MNLPPKVSKLICDLKSARTYKVQAQMNVCVGKATTDIEGNNAI
jgi:hypothetical protein